MDPTIVITASTLIDRITSTGEAIRTIIYDNVVAKRVCQGLIERDDAEWTLPYTLADRATFRVLNVWNGWDGWIERLLSRWPQ